MNAPTDRVSLRLLHGAMCRQWTQGECTLAFCRWHSGEECLPPQAGTCRCLPVYQSSNEAPTDRAGWWLLHGAMCSRTQGARSLSAAGTRMTSACHREQAPVGWCLPVHRSRHEATTDRASLRLLLHGAMCRRNQFICTLSAAGTRVKSACHREHAPAGACLCTVATMKQRLVEQACGCCSTVRCAGGLKVGAGSPSAAGTRVKSACHREQAPAGACLCTGATMKQRLIEQACGCCSTVPCTGGGLNVRDSSLPLALG